MTTRELNVELEAVTPLFLGGANQDEPEARAASFRGALRFWWRALAAEPNLDELRKREAAVFGDTNRASAVRVDVEIIGPARPLGWNAARNVPHAAISREDGFGLDYLGFSLRRTGQRPERVCLPAGTRLRLTLRLRRGADTGTLREAAAALWLLVNLGGLGTRARRGFGGLAVTSTVQIDDLPPWNPSGEQLSVVARRVQEGIDQVVALVKRSGTIGRPVEYPVLMNRHCWIVMLQLERPNWQALLGSVGRLLSAYRKPLYPRLVDLRNEGATDQTPERAAFGLPIQYFRPPTGQQRTGETYTLNVVEAGQGSAPGRRASPLLIKVMRRSEQRYGAILTVFQDFGPGFLPSSVQALSGGGLTIQALPSAKPLAGFLTRLADSRQRSSPDWPGSPGLIQVDVP